MTPKLPEATLDNGSIYIAGPMSGLPEYNFPAFKAAAEALRAAGWTVISPAELFEDTNRPWTFYMRHAIKHMLDAESIYMLSGWSNSRGAKVEWGLAQSLGMATFYESFEGT